MRNGMATPSVWGQQKQVDKQAQTRYIIGSVLISSTCRALKNTAKATTRFGPDWAACNTSQPVNNKRVFCFLVPQTGLGHQADPSPHLIDILPGDSQIRAKAAALRF